MAPARYWWTVTRVVEETYEVLAPTALEACDSAVNPHSVREVRIVAQVVREALDGERA